MQSEYKDELIEESYEIFPVYMDILEFKTPESEYHELLSKFEQGKVYKAYYREDKGFFLFPAKDTMESFMVPELEDETQNYKLLAVRITDENFHDFAGYIPEEDFEYMADLLGTTMKDEIAEKEQAVVARDLQLTKALEEYDNAFKVKDGEANPVFSELNNVDPKMARTLLEFTKYATLMLQKDGLDGVMTDILNDKDLGSGACVAGAMNNLIKHTKLSGDAAIANILKAALFTLIEVKRNTIQHG